MTAQLQVFADKSTSSIQTTDHRGNLPVIKTITGSVAQHPLCDRFHPFTARRHPEDTVLVESSFFRESFYGTKIQPIQSALYMTAYKSAYKSADSYHLQQTTAGLISAKTLKSTCINALINAWSLLGGINQTFLSCTSLILFQPQQINWSKWQTGSQRCDIVSMWLESQFNCVYFSLSEFEIFYFNLLYHNQLLSI